jgi:hypothetical protein
MGNFKVTMKRVLVLAIFVAYATETWGQNAIIGAGLDSCGTWTFERRTPSLAGALQDGQWVLGFLSAVGFAGALDPLRGVDARGVWAWIDNYCQANPLKNLTDAAIAFMSAHPH